LLEFSPISNITLHLNPRSDSTEALGWGGIHDSPQFFAAITLWKEGRCHDILFI